MKKNKSDPHLYCDVSVKFSLVLSNNLLSYALHIFFFFCKNSEQNLKKEIEDQKEFCEVAQVNTNLLQI